MFTKYIQWAAGIQAYSRPWLCRNIPRREFGLTLLELKNCTEKIPWQPSLVQPARVQSSVPASAHSCHQLCRFQMDPALGGRLISTLTWCTPWLHTGEGRFRQQFPGDLHSKPQTPVRMIRVCLPCSHCCVQRYYKLQWLQCQSYSMGRKPATEPLTLYTGNGTLKCGTGKIKGSPVAYFTCTQNKWGQGTFINSTVLSAEWKKREIAGSRVWEVLPLGFAPPAHTKVQQILTT